MPEYPLSSYCSHDYVSGEIGGSGFALILRINTWKYNIFFKVMDNKVNVLLGILVTFEGSEYNLACKFLLIMVLVCNETKQAVGGKTN